MNKSVLNQLEAIIKYMNEKNEQYTIHYDMHKPMQYKRGGYSVIIEYKMFSGVDLPQIMNFVIKNRLYMRLGTFPTDGTAYMDIQ
jgi:hypothetical protein